MCESRLYPRVVSIRFERLILRRAIKRLHTAYHCFGLKERLEETITRFQNRFGWTLRSPQEHHKATHERPRLAQLDPNVAQNIRAYNALDVALYKQAVQLFNGCIVAESSHPLTRGETSYPDVSSIRSSLLHLDV